MIKMNRSLHITIFIFFNFISCVYGQIDSVAYYMQELLPNRKVIRYPALDRAAKLHAEYMVTKKKTCHLQVENPNYYSVRDRANAVGDKSDFGYSEVVWGGKPFLDKSIKESIYYFQGSSAHWNIIIQKSHPILNVKFGYARLTTSDYDVCVIVLTNFFYDDPDLFIPKPSYFE